MLVLKPAETTHDMSLSSGVVVGSSVNQDGRSASMSAPNGPSQVEVMQRVVHQSGGATLRHLSETHGTGTALGDPVEVGALGVVFGSSNHSVGCMVLGALKSRLGHTEGAAGMMGLLKTVQVLMQCCVPPNLHLNKENDKLELDGFAVAMVSGVVSLVAQATPAGVSSFGMSGTNAHVALEGSEAQQIVAEQGRRVVQYNHTAFAWWVTPSTAATTEGVPLLGVSTTVLEAFTETQWERS